MHKIIALDFDGVICDSIDECMLVSYMAYTGSKSMPQAFIDYFRKHRHIVRPAREYFLIVDAYHRGIEPVPVDETRLMEFEPRYFAARERLLATNFQAWLNLHRVYPEFLEGWPQLRESTTPYIVTTRDRESLNHLLNYFGIDIPAERWWTKERSSSKPEAIRTIAAAHNIPVSKILFVDDHPEHLHDVAQTGASVVWARWGYWPSQNGFKSIACIKELTHE